MIEIGKYIESAVEWLTEHGAAFLTCWVWQWKESLTGFCISCLECPFISPLQSSPLWHGIKVAGVQVCLPSWACHSFTGWDSGRRPCRLWPWYSPPLAWHCCWESLWVSGWQAADAATKSCSRYLTACRLCRPLSI